MSRLGEIAIFASLAVAAHVGAWVGVGTPGAEAEGAEGQAALTLVASSAQLAEMVEDWTRPVAAMVQQPQITPPDLAAPAALTAPPRPSADASPALPAAPNPVAPQLPAALPQVDQSAERSAILDRAPAASPRPVTRPAPKRAAKPAPKQPAARPSAPVAAQKAAGAGAGQNAGKAKVQRSASLSKATRQKLIAQWGAKIRNRVERHKRYPAGTKARGKTVLRLTVARSGALRAVTVVRSSGDRKLDQAAIRAAKRARYPAAPKGLDGAQYKFNLPLSFSRS